MYAVGGKQRQHDEIRNEQSKIESVGLIQTFKGGVKEVLANVLRQSVLDQEYARKRYEIHIRGQKMSGSNAA